MFTSLWPKEARLESECPHCECGHEVYCSPECQQKGSRPPAEKRAAAIAAGLGTRGQGAENRAGIARSGQLWVACILRVRWMP